ncbi:hypothetical protein G5B38_03920 [Pseudohalocynthiibacter aestuariivivens]|uniref:Uncharacterized protein n=1 Tax=Roseovarius pelagicus TaxID=2980108 RepID=A0ABY6DB58_9RHOB|nr:MULTISPECIES: hypothetical protein [Rhodobacterales]QIE44741.1 hypothetical protein G5B38_03920 [Pseudohalocynthiibacter aestuariivivens]UXX83347.1 hypothetical protein N7U68_01280 [Roseovarius pelagicus]
MERDPLDHKRLIRESYRIDGIVAEECRSIFLDWALSLPQGQDTQAAIAVMLDRYGADNPDHPMTEVLRGGQQSAAQPRRRGGWKSRPRD